MANAFSNWGSGGSTSGWGGGGPSVSTPNYGSLPAPKSSGGHGFSLWGEISHLAGEIPGAGAISAPLHLGLSLERNFFSSPAKTGIGLEQLPHSFYAGPWAIAKAVAHDFGKASTESIPQAWNDPHGVIGGIIHPMFESYKQKYFSRDVLHHIEQDPLGTLLDLTVAGKLGGVAHLKMLERSAEAGHVPGPRAAQILSPRQVVLRPYPDAEGVVVPLDYRASTSFGRLFQSKLDEARFGKPGPGGVNVGGLPGTVSLFGHDVGVPFSRYGAFGRLDRRSREIVFDRQQRLEAAVHDTYKELPQNQVRAIAAIIGGGSRLHEDPIQHRIDFYQQQIDDSKRVQAAAKAAGEAVPKEHDQAFVKSREVKIQELKALDKKALYEDNPKLRAAVEAIRTRGEQVTAQGIAAGKLEPEQVAQRRFLEQKVESGGRNVPQHIEGGRTIPDEIKIQEQKRARLAMQDALKRRTDARKKLKDSWNSVIRHSTRSLRDLHDEYQGRVKRIGGKGKTFRQYVEEVYPKRQSGAIHNALFKHETLIDEERKANEAYIKARDEWHGRRPPMTRSGKGRQHHTVTEPSTVVSEAIRGGKSYEQLAKEEAAALEAYARGRGGAPPAAPTPLKFVRDKKTGHYTVEGHPEYHIEPRDVRHAGGGDRMVFGQPTSEGSRRQGYDIYKDGRLIDKHANLAGAKASIERRINAAAAPGEYGPLAQYGPSFRVPHMASTKNLDDAKFYTRAKAVLTRQADAKDWQRNSAVLFMRGQISSDPEAFHLSNLRQTRWFATEEHFDHFVVPQSGELDPALYASGGKLPEESYIRTKRSASVSRDVLNSTEFFRGLSREAEDAMIHEQADYVMKVLPDEFRKAANESDAAWVARMNDAGIRRVPAEIARLWQIQTRGSSLFRRMFLRNGLNQAWRFFLLGIKPAWSVANSFTNESLVAFRYLFTKGGATAFLNSLAETYGVAHAAELIQRLVRDKPKGIGLLEYSRLMQSDPRLAEAFAGNFGRQLDRQIQNVGSQADKWNRSIAQRVVAMTKPTTREFAPFKLVRMFAEANYRFNIHAENAARVAAMRAEITQVTGKMMHTAEDLQKALDSMSEADFRKVRSGFLDAMGDYSNLGSFEREWIVTYAPFYPWFKTIMGITAKWVTRHPERVWVLGLMAHTFQQAQNQDYQLGVPLPYFAEDSIPAGKPVAGEQRIITDRAFNPLVTPVDIINTARALTGDPNAQPSDLGLALMGPAASFLYVAFTNQDPFYGGTYQGPLAGTPAPLRGFGSLLATPQYRTIQQFGGIPGLVPSYKSKVYNTPAGPSAIPGMSEADLLAIEQYWGIPIRYANLQNLKTRGLSERGQAVSKTAPPAPPSYNPAPSTNGAFGNWG